MANRSGCAVIVGAGTGLGAALAQRFSHAGMNVVMARRQAGTIAAFAAELSGIGHRTVAMSCDAADPASVDRLFEAVGAEFGTPRLVVHNAGAFVRKPALDLEADDFERCWRTSCLGGFLVGQAAARAMLADPGDGRHLGTIVYTGATASLRGGAGFMTLAVGKFGLRAVAQSLARELHPKGIHVAHVIVDGQIRSDRPNHSERERGEDAVLHAESIAEAYWQLHCQHRSAWTQELDLRPSVERF